MHTIRPRRIAALLAVLALLLAAIPAVAAPPTTDRPVASETGVHAPLVHTLTSWLAALWPGPGPKSTRAGLGSVVDPGRAPQAAWQAIGGELDPNGAPESAGSVPTATPQLGPDGDPNG